MFSNLYNIMKKKKYSPNKENITSLNDIVVSLKDDEDEDMIDNELKTISEKNKYDTELLKKSAIFFLIRNVIFSEYICNNFKKKNN